MIGALHRFDPISKKNSFDQKMVMNLILVFLVCQCNEYVIPKSMSRKDLGYKSAAGRATVWSGQTGRCIAGKVPELVDGNGTGPRRSRA